jgi:hypothetical protein
MTILMRHAAWLLIVAFGLSLIYELYRATWRAGTSRHDSMRAFVVQGIPLYTLAGVVIALLFTGREWAAPVGLIFSVAMICVSIFYYNPRIMLARQPGIIDWFEDLVFTGLLFVAAALLLYAMFGAPSLSAVSVA